MHGTTTYLPAGMAEATRAARMIRTARPAWRRMRAPGAMTGVHGLKEAVRAGAGAGTDRLLLRAVLSVALLLVLVLVAGAARHALGMPAVTPAAAVGVIWLVGCAGVFGSAALVVASAYRVEE